MRAVLLAFVINAIAGMYEANFIDNLITNLELGLTQELLMMGKFYGSNKSEY